MKVIKPNRIIASLSILCFLSVASYLVAAGQASAAVCRSSAATAIKQPSINSPSV